MIYIESRENKIFKELKKLKNKKYRYEKKSYLIEGLRFVEDAVKSKVPIESIIFTEDFTKRHGKEASELLAFNNLPQIIMKDSLFRELSDTENPQGVLAQVSLSFAKPQVNAGIFVLVDKIQDPGNLGTIIRTADAVGASAVICTKGTVDFLNEKVLRSTMGSIFRVPVILEDENYTYIRGLSSQGYNIIGTSLGADRSIYDFDLSSKVVFCIGNEASGLSEEVLSLCHNTAIIPMVGPLESLNASVAASVVLFEALRQRIKK